MEFTDAWLLDDTEALDRICYIGVPTTPQRTLDTYGLGGSEVLTEINYQLACMEVPAILRVDHAQGILVKIPKNLIIKDPDGYIKSQRIITFSGQKYRIEEQIVPLQHTLKRVTLQQIELPL